MRNQLCQLLLQEAKNLFRSLQALAGRELLQPKGPVHGRQQLGKGDLRIGDENRREPGGIHLVQIGTQDSRFAHADFARDQHKALAFLNAIRDGGQRLLMTGTAKVSETLAAFLMGTPNFANKLDCFRCCCFRA